MSTIKVRASSWGALFDCAHKWEWETLMQHRKPVGIRAVLGTALHASTAVFDRAAIDHVPMHIDDAASVFVAKLQTPEYDVDYSADDLTERDAERIGLELHRLYCELIAPRMHYIDVEMTLKPFDIDCGGGLIVTLTGTMDRARVAQGPHQAKPVIPDVKSGKSVIAKGHAKTKGRSAQLGAYQLLFEHTRGIETGGAQILALQATSKPAVAVSPVFDARRVMVGTPTEPGLIEFAADMFRTGLFPPNPSSMLCDKKYCARWDHCNFHE
jgi:hypothetical protein